MVTADLPSIGGLSNTGFLGEEEPVQLANVNIAIKVNEICLKNILKFCLPASGALLFGEKFRMFRLNAS